MTAHRGVCLPCVSSAGRAVAERLGFRAEGIRHESHWITDRFVDRVVYGMLARDWEVHRDG